MATRKDSFIEVETTENGKKVVSERFKVMSFKDIIFGDIKYSWKKKGCYGVIERAKADNPGEVERVQAKAVVTAGMSEEEIALENESREVEFTVNLSGVTGEQVKTFLIESTTNMRKKAENLLLVTPDETVKSWIKVGYTLTADDLTLQRRSGKETLADKVKKGLLTVEQAKAQLAREMAALESL